MINETIKQAIEFAHKAHNGQKRKYTNTPYIDHPIRVATRLQERSDATIPMIAAAYLHDVVEDCGVTLEQIEQQFGKEIRDTVDWLTNKSKGSTLPRADRKKMDRERLSKAPKEIKIIKLIDRIDNLNEMQEAPSKFKEKYIQESLLLAGVIGDADELLKQELIAATNKIKNESPQQTTQEETSSQ